VPADPAQRPTGAYAEDDLPGFLDFPPGSATGPDPAPAGWPALSPGPERPAAVAADEEPTAGRETAGALVAMALVTLLLVGVAAAVAATRSPDTGRTAAHGDVPAAPPAAPAPGQAGAADLADASVAPGADGAAAQLTFGGVVLERRAVGVTATYPMVGLTWDGHRAVAHVELPTFNCLSDQAPADPTAAGCTRSLTEYAELAAPGLQVRREGDRLLVSGAFPTYLRPNGTQPVWTGRWYELSLTAEPERGTADRGWQPAQGVMELGSDRAPATGANRIRFGG
jgi:hypothetical protein